MLSDCPACRAPCDQEKRHAGSPVVEKAPLRPASTRSEYQTFRCDYSYRHGPPVGPVLPRKSPPLSACRQAATPHTCRVTTSMLSGRTDNDDTCHGLVPERSAHPRSPHSRQTPTPHSTPRPHQSEHPHAGKPHRRTTPRRRRPRLGAATHRRTRHEHDRDGRPHHSGAPGRIGARNPRTLPRRGTPPRHLRRHARRTRRIQQGSCRRLRPRQPPPRASHHPRRRPGPRDRREPFGTGRPRCRRAHYRRTRPGLGPQPDRERARRRRSARS